MKGKKKKNNEVEMREGDAGGSDEAGGDEILLEVAMHLRFVATGYRFLQSERRNGLE